MLFRSNVPVPVGTPLTVPLAVSRRRPVGSEPAEMLHTYGAAPLVAASACEYDVPVVAGGMEAVVIEGGVSTVMDNAFVPTRPTASVACTVMLLVPLEFGVPVIAPVVAFRLRPLGSVPVERLQVYEPLPPDAASVLE